MLRRLRTTEEFDAAVSLQLEVWGGAFSGVVPTGVLRVVQYVGGVVAGAFTEAGELAGLVFGVSGIRDERLSHWSDTLAVRQEFRNRGIGEDLKRYQRDLLLPLGVQRVYWTFDPLESRNAYLNFNRLGVSSGEYRRDFYGATHSKLHEDIGTDRLLTVWEIASPHVAHRGIAARRSSDASRSRRRSAHQRRRRAGRCGGDARAGSRACRAATPPCHPGRHPAGEGALAGHRARVARVTRTAFETYFARGYVARSIIRVGACSEYLLELDEQR